MTQFTNYTTVCRGCLVEAADMKNMEEWGLADDFYSLTNISKDLSVELSQWLCSPCEEMLATSRRFRVQCQRTDRILHEDLEKTKKQYAESLSSSLCKETSTINITGHLEENTATYTITTSNTNKKIYLLCPFCDYCTIKKNELQKHVIKTHKKSSAFGIITEYYCPVESCAYNKKSERKKFFSGRKFLNQHLAKVHSEKIFTCNTCKMSFSKQSDLFRHGNECSVTFLCGVCNLQYKNNEAFLVHLKRKHPDIHKQYKSERKSLKQKHRLSTSESLASEKKKLKLARECESPKRNFATQTLCNISTNIKNDITLPSWVNKSDDERNYNNTQTQTVFEDTISFKSQNSDDSLFFAENVSLTDIHTQTYEFGLSRKTITSETQTRAPSPDFTKQTQTCVCLYDSPKFNFKLFDSINSSPMTSAETQTGNDEFFKSELFSIETQTNFDEKDDF